MKKFMAILVTLVTMFGMFATVNADEGMMKQSEDCLYKRNLEDGTGYGDYVHVAVRLIVLEINNKDHYIIDTDGSYVYEGIYDYNDVKMTYGEFASEINGAIDSAREFAAEIEANYPVDVQFLIYVENV